MERTVQLSPTDENSTRLLGGWANRALASHAGSPQPLQPKICFEALMKDHRVYGVVRRTMIN